MATSSAANAPREMVSGYQYEQMLRTADTDCRALLRILTQCELPADSPQSGLQVRFSVDGPVQQYIIRQIEPGSGRVRSQKVVQIELAGSLQKLTVKYVTGSTLSDPAMADAGQMGNSETGERGLSLSFNNGELIGGTVILNKLVVKNYVRADEQSYNIQVDYSAAGERQRLRFPPVLSEGDYLDVLPAIPESINLIQSFAVRIQQ